MKDTFSVLLRLCLLASCLRFNEATAAGRLRAHRSTQTATDHAKAVQAPDAASTDASATGATTDTAAATTTADPLQPAIFFKTKQLDFNVNRLQTEMDTLKTEMNTVSASLPSFEATLARLKVAADRDRSFVNNNSMMLARVKTTLSDGVVKTKLTPATAKLQSLNTTLRALETKLGVKDADLSKGTPGQQVDGFNRSWVVNQSKLVEAYGSVSALEGNLDLNATQLADNILRKRLDAIVGDPNVGLAEEVSDAMEAIKIKPPKPR